MREDVDHGDDIELAVSLELLQRHLINLAIGHSPRIFCRCGIEFKTLSMQLWKYRQPFQQVAGAATNIQHRLGSSTFLRNHEETPLVIGNFAEVTSSGIKEFDLLIWSDRDPPVLGVNFGIRVYERKFASVAETKTVSVIHETLFIVLSFAQR